MSKVKQDKSWGGGPRGVQAPRAAPEASPFQVEEGKSAIRVDLSRMKPPDRVFSATWAEVRDTGPFVQLHFSDPVSGRAKVDTVFVFEVSKHKMRDVLTTEDWATNLLKNPIEGARPQVEVDFADAKFWFQRANLVVMAISDLDSEIQFFHISPRRVADVLRHGGSDLADGVVSMSVVLGADLLHQLVRETLELL